MRRKQEEEGQYSVMSKTSNRPESSQYLPPPRARAHFFLRPHLPASLLLARRVQDNNTVLNILIALVRHGEARMHTSSDNKYVQWRSEQSL